MNGTKMPTTRTTTSVMVSAVSLPMYPITWATFNNHPTTAPMISTIIAIIHKKPAVILPTIASLAPYRARYFVYPAQCVYAGVMHANGFGVCSCRHDFHRLAQLVHVYLHTVGFELPPVDARSVVELPHVDSDHFCGVTAVHRRG